MDETINYIKDMHEATEFELKHTPKVEVENDGDARIVYVTIGLKGITHPQTEEHYIEWIRILVDDKVVAGQDFTPDTPPITEARFEADGQITVRALCNLHGIWETKV